MEAVPGNQLGNVGIYYPNALGDQFALSQATGNSLGGGAGSNIFSTVSLTQSGDLIFAEPGDSSVNIGQTTTGQNVQYISQMAGTTMINSPVVINGNVAIPHQYTFSMNPENNPTLPTATLNANVTVGGAGTVALGSVGTPLSGVNVYSGGLNVVANTVDLQGSNSYVQIDQTNPGVEVVSQSGNVGISAAGLINNTANNFFVSSANTRLSADSVFSVSTNQGSINMNAASNVNINSSGSNVNIESYYITNVKGSDVNVLADTGLSAFNTPIINVTAQNGPLGGLINLDAYASYGQLAGYGHVTINAHGSENNPVTPIGGLIEMNAYSAGVGSFGGATSAIRLNAATINLNAGAIPPFLSLAGSAVLYGNNIVSICAGAPAILPQIPLTTYIYGTAGLRLDCGTGARVTSLGILQAPNVELDIVRANSNAGLGVYFADPISANVITPQPSFFVPNGGGDLFIRGSNTIFRNSYVQLQDIGSLSFATAYASNVTGAITGLSTINGQAVGAFSGASWSLYNQISSLSSITADVGVLSTLNVSTVNGTVFEPWYNVPAAGPVSMANNSINNASYIITSNLYSGKLNGLFEGAAQGCLAISTTSSLTMMSASSITITAPTVSISTLSSINGAPYINTQDWSLSEAITNIDAAGNNVGNVGTVFTNNISITNDFTMTNNGNVADFGSNALINVSSLNGQPVANPAGTWVSTATTQLNMSEFDIVNANTVAANSFVGGPSAIDSISTNAIKCFGNINMTLTNIFSTNIIRSVGGAVTTQMDTGGFFGNGVSAVSYVDTPSLRNISSINGAPYNPGGWVGTAATNLNMNSFDIANAKDITASNTITCSLVSAGTVSAGSVSVGGNQAITTVTATNGLVKIQNPNTGTININPDDIFTKREDIGSLATTEVPVFAGNYLFTNDSVGSQQNMFITINIIASITQSGRYYFVSANRVYTGALSQYTLQIAGVTKTTLNGLGNNTVITFDVIQGANGAPGIANLAVTAILS